MDRSHSLDLSNVGICVALLACVSSCQQNLRRPDRPEREVPVPATAAQARGEPTEDKKSPPATRLEWSSGPELPQARDHHATLMHGSKGRSHLLVSGGGADGFRRVLGDVVRAEVGADGSVRAWTTVGALPRPTAGHTWHRDETHVYALGGMHPEGEGFALSADCAAAPIDPEGRQLGEWAALPPLPQPLWHHQSVLWEGSLYVFGGVTHGGTPLDTVVRGDIEDGRVAAWTALEPLPEPRSHAGFAFDGERVYLVGGLQGAELLASVVVGTFAEDGAIDWQRAPALPTPRVTPGAAIVGGQLIVAAGLGPPSTDMTEMFPDEAFGLDLQRQAAWVPLDARLPVPTSHVHQLPANANRVFMIGGRTLERDGGRHLSTAAVQIGEVVMARPANTARTEARRPGER